MCYLPREELLLVLQLLMLVINCTVVTFLYDSELDNFYSFAPSIFFSTLMRVPSLIDMFGLCV
jgi:hypothetical protein